MLTRKLFQKEQLALLNPIQSICAMLATDCNWSIPTVNFVSCCRKRLETLLLDYVASNYSRIGQTQEFSDLFGTDVYKLIVERVDSELKIPLGSWYIPLARCKILILGRNRSNPDHWE
jgi:hypothetical protein